MHRLKFANLAYANLWIHVSIVRFRCARLGPVFRSHPVVQSNKQSVFVSMEIICKVLASLCDC